jgi:hypothetical protein
MLEPVLPATIDTSPALPLEVAPVLIAILPDVPLADEPLLIDTEPLLAFFVAEAVDTVTDSPTLLRAAMEPPDKTKLEEPLELAPTDTTTSPLVPVLDAPLLMDTTPLEPAAAAPETSDKAPELPELLDPEATETAPLCTPEALPTMTTPLSESTDDPLRIFTLPPWLPALTSTPALTPD